MKKLTLLLLALTLLLNLPPSPPALAAADPNPTLRIGLYYGDNALPAANLQNFTGSGYRMGYLDGNRSFVEVGRLDNLKITMLKNRNMYLKNGEYAETASSGAVTVGCFHIDANLMYGSFNDAQSMAVSLRGRGLKAFPAYVNGAWRVRAGAYATTAEATAAIPGAGLSGATALSGSAYCVSVVNTDTGDILFQFDGGESQWLAVRPSSGEVSDPVTWFKGYKYRGGFEYRRVTGNNMTIVNWVTMQDYVKGVIPYEMSPSWPIEALKAQALCAKCYALTNQNKHRSLGFDLCNTTDCQVYYGVNAATANSDRAVDETYGTYVYHNGQLAQTFYHDSDGGSTESARNVWGTEIPYLQAVTDTFEYNDSSWQSTYTNGDITQILKDKGYSTGSIVNAYIDQFTPAGNVYRLTVVDGAGKTYNFERESARTVLNSPSRKLYVNSQRYTISGGGGGAAFTIAGASGTVNKSSAVGLYAISGSGIAPVTVPASDLQVRAKGGVSNLSTTHTPNAGSGTYVVNGRGRGHNVGMSQYGAKAMAEKGYSAADIIRFYYTGVTVG